MLKIQSLRKDHLRKGRNGSIITHTTGSGFKHHIINSESNLEILKDSLKKLNLHSSDNGGKPKYISLRDF